MYQQTNPIYQNSKAVRDMVLLLMFSSHSGRVWALVLLDEAGMTPDFMKLRLRWIGDSYRLYLRDTSILQQKHIEALKRTPTKYSAS